VAVVTPQDLRELAALAMAERPDLYTQVTGLPVWWDAVGHEYNAAQRKWRRFIEKEVASARQA
jgi:hypothetical protein